MATMAIPMIHEIHHHDLEFFEKLGGGAHGSVYRAKWTSRNMEVAAKKILVMEIEASVLSELSHPNIIQFYGAVLKEPNYCLVTEYAENGSLNDYLQQPSNSLDFDRIINWAKDIARGINYLHNEAPVKVIHRDLKSHNVVITRDWKCKICDFGSSTFFKSTTQMSFVGTYPWMAPEVIQSKPVSKSCDTWSYGVCLWELLTNEVPFKGMEGLQVAWAVGNGKKLTIPSSCPPCFGKFMEECWNSEPKERPTFKEILSTLDNMCKDESLQSITNSFVRNKSAWVAEIDEAYDLNVKEKDLMARETNVKLQIKQTFDIGAPFTATNVGHGERPERLERFGNNNGEYWKTDQLGLLPYTATNVGHGERPERLEMYGNNNGEYWKTDLLGLLPYTATNVGHGERPERLEMYGNNNGEYWKTDLLGLLPYTGKRPERLERYEDKHENWKRELLGLLAVEEKQKGNAAYLKREFDKALEHFEKAIGLDRTNIGFYTNAAAVYFQKHEFDECIKVCNVAIEVGRENRADYKAISRAFMWQGKAYQEQNKYEEALKCFSKSLFENSDPDIYERIEELQEMIGEQAYLDIN